MSTATASPARARKARILAPPVTGQEIVLIGVIALLWTLLAFNTPAFLTASSIQPLLGNVAPIALIGIGMTIVIITAGIDVSVGANIAVSAVVVAKIVLVQAQQGIVVALLAGILVGGALGLLNGFLIAYGRVHAIIITFGTANLFQWLSLRLFDSSTVNNIPETLAALGNGAAGRALWVPNSFLIALLLTALAWLYLRHTAGGRHFYAIGGDEVAAQLAGVNVKRRILLAYMITGLLVGLASCVVVAQGSNLGQTVGAGKELAVIAAVVIGGTSITGGRGSVLGTVLGALLVQTVASGVTQLGWRSELSDLFVGLAIIVAVGTDLIRERARRKA
ncbi:MAG: ABC transporter permease [Tessaracoccus sp.]|uniref:ABC transporter permease n=1 Tax=Tessaracoccus sp. TaxID=1971211 RepID=UPI001EC2B2C5|nr:ABC transporter permease [Tessaracoccus sp.]MBK7819731.1 ABC transporter permease [Tessaracoccus sp.]